MIRVNVKEKGVFIRIRYPWSCRNIHMISLNVKRNGYDHMEILNKVANSRKLLIWACNYSNPPYFFLNKEGRSPIMVNRHIITSHDNLYIKYTNTYAIITQISIEFAVGHDQRSHKGPNIQCSCDPLSADPNPHRDPSNINKLWLLKIWTCPPS